MTLLFIYNANSGKLNALFDAGHKIFNPSTYPCSLCALTFDTFTENKTWKDFRKESNLNMEFYHKDEFMSKFPNVKIAYPSVLKLENNQVTTLFNNEVLNEILNIDELILSLKKNL
jgi:hypothetical protein